ncbi:MAG: hypothetical protein [Microvirus sp.]|nr:MAG: hypothetical protein [Microvirus sp.]
MIFFTLIKIYLMKKINVFNRWTNRPPSDGQKFKKKSMCIPGQEITPAEILRRYVQGFPIPEKIYTDIGIQEFRSLTVLDQIDYLRDLSDTNRASSQAVDLAIEKVKNAKVIADKKAHEDFIREKVITEMQSKNPGKT